MLIARSRLRSPLARRLGRIYLSVGNLNFSGVAAADSYLHLDDVDDDDDEGLDIAAFRRDRGRDSGWCGSCSDSGR